MDTTDVMKSLGLDEYATVEEAVLELCRALRAAGYEPECVKPYEDLAASHAR